MQKIVKANKGITLVALVITIAIMLILAGVTISVSLKGGLFSKAKEVTSQMQIDIEREQLLTVALGTLERNGKVNLNELDNNLPEGFTGINGQYTSSTGNKYQVTEDADIILLDGTEEPETPIVCAHTNTRIEGAIVATCTTAGYTGNTVCADCGETISNGSTIVALGHTTTEGTCANCGEVIENLNHSNIIPEGATYTQYINGRSVYDDDEFEYDWEYDSVVIYVAGDNFPTTMNNGDEYVFGDYKYCYGYQPCCGAIWSKACACDPETIEGWSVLAGDFYSTEYGSILKSINNEAITSMKYTFYNCGNLIDASNIVIPEKVTNLYTTFGFCVKLVKIPQIHNNVTNLGFTFNYCYELTGTVIIDSNPTNYSSCLYNTKVTSVKKSDGTTHPMEAELLATKTY